MRRNSVRMGVLLLSTSTLAVAADGAWAQGAENSPQPEQVAEASDAADGTVEPAQETMEIVVTGSRIRGVAPVGSTVLAVGREDIAATAAVSTSDVFRDIPQVVNVGIGETNRGAQGGAGNITYANSVNLRGIGPAATLTLINGHRVPGAGTRAEFVDPSVIPIMALERVEVVADGSSAIYGSDAIAGVVNLILRRDLDGVEANVRFGVADDYDTRQIGLGVGHIWDTGQFMVAAEHSYHSALAAMDRDYIRSDLRPFGGPNLSSTNCNPGTIVVGGVTYAIPEGGVTPANANQLVPNTINRCEVGAFSDVIPEIDKNSVVATFQQEITPRITFSADGFYYFREFTKLSSVTAQPLSVPRSNAFFVAPPGTNPNSVTVNYFFGNDPGPSLPFEGTSEAYQGTAGLDFDISDRWNLDVAVSYGHSEDNAINYGPDPAALAAALASSDPTRAFNPFGGPNSPAVIDAIGGTNYVRLGAPGENDLLQIQGKIDGSLFAIPGGDVLVALGAEYNQIDIKTGARQGRRGALTGSDLVLGRDVTSAFAEVLVPIFGPGNSRPFFHELTLNVAGRYDSYSDVGDTWNPKIGFNWEPIEGLRVRGNWGTSFRAPFLTQLVSSNASIQGQSFVDPLSPTGFTSGYGINEGNLNLVPEEAETWLIGLDIEPSLVPGFNLSATYFNVEYTGQIQSLLGDLTVLQREELYPGLIIRNPTQQQIDELLARLPLRGPPLPSVGVLIDARPNNLGVSKVDGIDFVANYRLLTESAGTFGIGINGIWYNNYDVAQSAQAPLIERIGFINYPTEYRLRGNIEWQWDMLRAIAFINHVPSYTNNSISPEEEIDSWTTVDLNLALTLPQATGWYKDLTFSVNVQNLLDEDPPYASLAPTANQSGGYDAQQSNPLGRLVTFGVAASF